MTEEKEIKISMVTWVSPSDYKQKKYAIIACDPMQLEALNKAIASMEEYVLNDYGIVLDTGNGVPGQDIIDKIAKEYGISLDTNE